MNKNMKSIVAKQTARRILEALSREKCFDGFVSRLYNDNQCLSYFNKSMAEYFRHNDRMLNWNKMSWINIFDDKDLIETLVWYMQDFNLAKEIEEENKDNIKKKTRH